jgi:rhodanese-related sulfurtransferase
MPISISLSELLALPAQTLLIDVRRTAARSASGRTIPNSLRHEPERVADWSVELVGRTVVAFCVYGHEVSQKVADSLVKSGVDAVYLDGGFAAWEAGGNPVVAIGGES